LGEGEGQRGLFSAGYMLSSEEAGVDRPRAGADHGQSAAEDGKNDRDPFIARPRERDPRLNRGDEPSRNGSPQARQDEERQHTSGYIRNHQAGPRAFELCYAAGEQSDAGNQSLNEKAEARPAIRECGEKTLQGALKTEGTAPATPREALKAGT